MRGMNIYGVEISVPTSWADHTVHRFAAPVRETPALPLVKQAPAFRSNLVVTRYPLDKLETFFSAHNASVKLRNFTVLGGGSTHYLKQPAVWQDSSHVEPSQGLHIFQRQIAVAHGNACVVMTLSAASRTLDQLAAEIGFTSST